MENWTVKSVDGADMNEAPSAQEKEQAVVEAAAAETPNVEIQGESDVIKVNLDQPPVQKEEAPVAEETVEEVKPEEDAIQDGETEKVSVGEQAGDSQEVDEQVREHTDEEESVIELIQDEVSEVPSGDETQLQEVKEETPVAIQDAPQLPENVEKLVAFMEETGGTVEDYINLNKSYDDMDPVDVLTEYYKQSKPHLDQSEIDFLMEDKFSFDADADDPREIKKKQLAFKEELYDAKKALASNKDKYYADLKLNKQSELTPELKEAQSFYQDYKQSQEENQKLSEAFNSKTEKLFSDEFKGFDFKVGDNKYRFKVSDVEGTKTYQSDLNNFIGEFAGEDGSISDVAGYHKALFAAKNADRIAQHFYEQGRAEALKNSARDSKNIDMNPRGDAASVVRTKTGTQFKVVSGDSSNGLKFKMKK